MTGRAGALRGGAVLIALGLASCSTQRPAPPPEPVAPQPAPRPPAALAASPSDYVATAGSFDLFVVRASELALVKSGDPRIRALATRLAEEHRGLAAQLSMAGRRLDALPAARLLEREQKLLTMLDREPRFDAAYRRIIESEHARSWEAHARFANRGSSPTLRPVAANGERVERAHLTMLGLL